jgi:DUF4097 and DUF4098 domain-containing protein YvlB
MIRRNPCCLALLWLIVCSNAALARRIYDSREEFHYHGRLGSGKAIEIRGVNGDVSAEPSTSGEVEVVAWKRSESGRHAEIKVTVSEHAGGTTVAALYPAPSDAEVRFLVRVPAGVRFIGRTSNGKVEASGMRGPVEAHTVNGDIQVKSESVVEASTVNGSIRAEARRARLATVNGNVTLTVPPDRGMELDATTMHGAFIASVPFTKLGESARNHWHGTVGRGGPVYDLKTVNGDIHLERN